MRSEAAKTRRVAEALHGRGGEVIHFDARLHPHDREGRFRETFTHPHLGVARVAASADAPAMSLNLRERAAVHESQRLQRNESLMRLRHAGGEQGLETHLDVLGRARQHADRELQAHGLYLTPNGDPVRIPHPDNPEMPRPGEDHAFWERQAQASRAAAAAAATPEERAMHEEHAARMEGPAMASPGVPAVTLALPDAGFRASQLTPAEQQLLDDATHRVYARHGATPHGPHSALLLRDLRDELEASSTPGGDSPVEDSLEEKLHDAHLRQAAAERSQVSGRRAQFARMRGGEASPGVPSVNRAVRVGDRVRSSAGAEGTVIKVPGARVIAHYRSERQAQGHHAVTIRWDARDGRAPVEGRHVIHVGGIEIIPPEASPGPEPTYDGGQRAGYSEYAHPDTGHRVRTIATDERMRVFRDSPVDDAVPELPGAETHTWLEQHGYQWDAATDRPATPDEASYMGLAPDAATPEAEILRKIQTRNPNAGTNAEYEISHVAQKLRRSDANEANDPERFFAYWMADAQQRNIDPDVARYVWNWRHPTMPWEDLEPGAPEVSPEHAASHREIEWHRANIESAQSRIAEFKQRDLEHPPTMYGNPGASLKSPDALAEIGNRLHAGDAVERTHPEAHFRTWMEQAERRGVLKHDAYAAFQQRAELSNDQMDRVVRETNARAARHNEAVIQVLRSSIENSQAHIAHHEGILGITHTPEPADGRIPGATAIVGGRAGRWVKLNGKQTHIPHHEVFTRDVGGDVFTSDAGSTVVHKNGMLYNAPRSARRTGGTS